MFVDQGSPTFLGFGAKITMHCLCLGQVLAIYQVENLHSLAAMQLCELSYLHQTRASLTPQKIFLAFCTVSLLWSSIRSAVMTAAAIMRFSSSALFRMNDTSAGTLIHTCIGPSIAFYQLILYQFIHAISNETWFCLLLVRPSIAFHIFCWCILLIVMGLKCESVQTLKKRLDRVFIVKQCL